MKKITIDCFCYEKNGRSCGRCGDSRQVLLKALEKIEASLRERNIAVDVREHKVDDSSMEQSNRVSINGKDIMAILQEREGIFSYCRSCTELSGRPTECRTFIYRSMAYESVPEEMIIEAVLKEAGS